MSSIEGKLIFVFQGFISSVGGALVLAGGGGGGGAGRWAAILWVLTLS